MTELYSNSKDRGAIRNQTSNDFLIAKYCTKTMPFLRNISLPVGNLDCGDSYYCDPHTCSATPNYIFYKLATSPGWSIQRVGKMLLIANELYWEQETSVTEAGCSMGSIVVDMPEIADCDTAAVFNAWAAVGISLSHCSFMSQHCFQPKLF